MSEDLTTDKTRKAITFHDLRATGLTWMAIRGDEPLRIMQRAGHESFATTQLYVREAEAIREGFGEVFPPLTPLLEPSPTGERSKIGPKKRDLERLKRGVSRRYVAGWTGLEPAASGVTGRRYNQLNYHPKYSSFASLPIPLAPSFSSSRSLEPVASSVGGTGFEPATAGL